jgi:hypothetical protein
MALYVYKRIRQDPIQLNVNGRLVIVKQGQILTIDNRYMLGVPGFAFIGFANPDTNFEPANTNLMVSRARPLIQTNVNEPEQRIIENINNINKPTIKPNVIEVESITIVNDEPPSPPQPTIEEPIQPGFKKDTLEKLKSFDNKQWFALKKEEVIKFLDDAKIEYKHISNDKWELLKFLKKIIKEL